MGQRLSKVKTIAIVVVIATIAAIVYWPRKYRVGEQLGHAIVFWHDDEAFLFLGHVTTGNADHPLREKLRFGPWAYIALALLSDASFGNMKTTAHRLTGAGVQELPLPTEATTWGQWGLHEGRLELKPPVRSFGNAPGFRWDGHAFVPLPPAAPTPAAGSTALTPDDLGEENDEGETGFIAKPEAEAFKKAGWHYKMISPYQPGGGTEAVLPLTLSGQALQLKVRNFPMPTRDLGGADFDSLPDLMAMGFQSLEVDGLPGAAPRQVLWKQEGWRNVSRAEFEALAKRHGQQTGVPFYARTWIWIAAVLMLAQAKPAWILLSLATRRGSILKMVATTYSYPPATTAQFPALDTAALARHTQELEGLGFERLLDFSLVGDVPNQAASFCRLFVHTRHHCFAEVMQIFPAGARPMPVGCAILSHLQDGWSVGGNNQKPMAFDYLFRRPKALGVRLPGVGPAELLSRVLDLRHRVCADLSLAPLGDDTFEAYVQHSLRTLAESREILARKNMAVGLPATALRWLWLRPTRPSYEWRGDYPREAERRRQTIRPT